MSPASWGSLARAEADGHCFEGPWWVLVSPFGWVGRLPWGSVGCSYPPGGLIIEGPFGWVGLPP